MIREGHFYNPSKGRPETITPVRPYHERPRRVSRANDAAIHEGEGTVSLRDEVPGYRRYLPVLGVPLALLPSDIPAIVRTAEQAGVPGNNSYGFTSASGERLQLEIAPAPTRTPTRPRPTVTPRGGTVEPKSTPSPAAVAQVEATPTASTEKPLNPLEIIGEGKLFVPDTVYTYQTGAKGKGEGLLVYTHGSKEAPKMAVVFYNQMEGFTGPMETIVQEEGSTGIDLKSMKGKFKTDAHLSIVQNKDGSFAVTMVLSKYAKIRTGKDKGKYESVPLSTNEFVFPTVSQTGKGRKVFETEAGRLDYEVNNTGNGIVDPKVLQGMLKLLQISQ
jgi:hypothetical protein